MKCRQLNLLLLLQQVASTWALSEFNAQFVQQVLGNMNASVAPCEDFYGYACGKWSEHYKDSNNYLDMPGYMDHKLNEQLLQALQQQQHATNGSYAQLWAYFVSCRDVQQPALNELLHRLEAPLQLEWPIFRNQSVSWRNATQFDWLGTLARLRGYGLNDVLLHLDTSVRHQNATHYVLLLAARSSAAAPLTAPKVEALYVSFGLPATQAKQLTALLLQLDAAVVQLTQQQRERPYEFVECTLAELQQRLPQIDWSHYLQALLEAPPAPDQLLHVTTLDANYLERLKQVLAGSSNETICYYLMFKLLYLWSDELPSSERRDLDCVIQLRGHMPLAMMQLYEQHYYATRRATTDAALLQIQQQLSLQLELELLQSNRMQLSPAERHYVLEELHSLQLKIGNVPPQLSLPQMNAYYQDLQLSPKDFYGNKLQLLRFYERQMMQQLRNVPRSLDFDLQPAFVARSSSPVKTFQNAVMVPHGYLQLPLYDARLAPLLQYATLGFILAHELQHAFGYFHIVYDARSHYSQTGLELLQRFDNFTRCLGVADAPDAAQQLQLSERMADIVGLRLAYDAYFNQQQQQSSAYPLVSNFTQQQLFFITSVQFLCADMAKITAQSQPAPDHGEHGERVNRNWPHLEHFSVAFNCSKDQAMFQQQPCRLW
ncbi:endothelin-converting enzyme-like 1 [Drosophila busckii]|uniref:endothelin-converting enzyme-like 1 n=1 Tax=Drosophila busckii TaxID=30019 RepID=UPI00083F0542|nr:endothelin-converting enzyme-like 1 [Drosophila busckii]